MEHGNARTVFELGMKVSVRRSGQNRIGDGAAVWVRMQGAYDTWHAEREEDVSKSPTLRAKAA